MNGPVFHAVVVAHVDEDGDSSLEIIWADRRLLISINPSDVGKGYVPHGWSLTVRDEASVARPWSNVDGVDLASMHDALVALAAWQRANDEDSAVKEHKR